MYEDYYFVYFSFLFFIEFQSAMFVQKLESRIGSTIILPPCLSSSSINNKDIDTIWFKSDTGELLTMNGELISNNPRFSMRYFLSSTMLTIHPVELADEGQYECRSDQIINRIVHLSVINSSTIHLTVVEGSNVTLHCMQGGMWIIEETERGGPVRTQYTSELILNDIQRDDARFQSIICSTLDGRQKREYLIDITYKPIVRVMMSASGRLVCIACAHPLPHRVQWWWMIHNERKNDAHQIPINQSCITQQINSILEKENESELTVTCEAENIYGIDRDSFSLPTRTQRSTTRSTIERTPESNFTERPTTITLTLLANRSSSNFRIDFVDRLLFCILIFIRLFKKSSA